MMKVLFKEMKSAILAILSSYFFTLVTQENFSLLGDKNYIAFPYF